MAALMWLLSTPSAAWAQASIQATTPFSSWDTIQISGSVQSDGAFPAYCVPANDCYLLDVVAWAEVSGSGGYQGGYYESWGSDQVSFQPTDAGPPQTMEPRTYQVIGGVTWTYCINLPPGCQYYEDQHQEDWDAQVTAQPATTINSFAPSSGSGHAQTFSMQIGDPAGANDLYVVLLRVSQTAGGPPWANECLVRYWRPTNTLEIIDDAGNGGGSAVVGTGGWLENSRCRAYAPGATATLSGTTLTLTIPMEFKATYVGAKNLYVLAYNMAQQGIRWWDVGDWTVTMPCQYVVSPGSPSLASSSGDLTFSITTTPECPWSAPATSGFLTRTTGGSGSGSGQVSYSYPENPNTTPRSTQPIIAAQTVTVTQVGDGQNPTGDEVVYYHHDAIGSVRVVSDASGNVLRRHDFLPFGQEWQPSSAPERLLFTSQERDPETGLDYFGARHYASLADRFTSPDPLAVSVSKLFKPFALNKYAYARLNPLGYADPSGLSECVIGQVDGSVGDGDIPVCSSDVVNVIAGLGPAMLQAIKESEAFVIEIPWEPDPAPTVDPSAGGGGQPGGSPTPGAVRRRLNMCEKDTLTPYIPKTDLNRAWLRIDQVPDFPGFRDRLSRNFRAMTLGNEIYMFPGEYDPQTAGGLALLAHELTHVKQFRKGIIGGLNLFTLPFYKRFETRAQEVEIRVLNDLMNFVGC